MVHLKRRIFVLRVTSNANFIYTMEHKRLKILIQFLFVFCILTKAVQSIPPRRVCLEYDSPIENELENNNTLKKRKCSESQNMCFILWKREVRNGEERIAVLKRGCWSYENNEKEACSNTNCVSLGSYDRPNNTEFCCCQRDLCNRVIKFIGTFTRTEKSHPSSSQGLQDTEKEENLVLTGIMSSATAIMILVSGIVATLFWKRKRLQKEVVRSNNGTNLPFHSDLKHARLICLISQGKFGEIWQGTVNSKVVAIKKFDMSHKNSWAREKEIYSLGLEHPGILKFFGASVHYEKDNMSFILVVEYHPRGSLRHFLRSTTFPWQEMCKMSYSIAEALAYLHGEVATVGKELPCIVHRDITSENILVKEDGFCVLCDLGLSRVMSAQEDKGHIDCHERHKVGSLRYMAPEALEGHINLNDVVAQLKQIDIYALGIVLWEISTRCQDICKGHVVPKFRLPFEELESDPTSHTIKNCVLARKARPSFLDIWNGNDQSVKNLEELIEECWDQDAEARLSASCVCQRIIQLKQYHI